MFVMNLLTHVTPILTSVCEAASGLFVSLSPLTLLSRAVVAAVWLLALVDLWRHREAPMANQAMAAAVALIVGQFLLIYHQSIPQETMFFFLAMGQVVLATAVMRIFRWVASVPGLHEMLRENKPTPGDNGDNPVVTYGKIFLTVAITGIVYFTLAYLEYGSLGY